MFDWLNQTSAAVQIATLPSGEINYDELEGRLRANVARPAIINVNIGTTVRACIENTVRGAIIRTYACQAYSPVCSAAAQRGSVQCRICRTRPANHTHMCDPPGRCRCRR